MSSGHAPSTSSGRPRLAERRGRQLRRALPGLRQMFWVGDGLPGVPADAPRLFFGIVDGNGSGLPGCYGDNSGGFTLKGQVRGR